MLGCMSMSSDGSITLIAIPNPHDLEEILIMVQVDGVALDPIPLNVADLRKMLAKIPNDT